MKRKILVILSNRWNRLQEPRFIELDADDEGNILKELPLRRRPRQPAYHEVWENDEAKNSLASCHRIKRKYGHPLEKRREASPKPAAARKRAAKKPKSKK